VIHGSRDGTEEPNRKTNSGPGHAATIRRSLLGLWENLPAAKAEGWGREGGGMAARQPINLPLVQSVNGLPVWVRLNWDWQEAANELGSPVHLTARETQKTEPATHLAGRRRQSTDARNGLQKWQRGEGQAAAAAEEEEDGWMDISDPGSVCSC
jgi:hypothetical protein